MDGTPDADVPGDAPVITVSGGLRLPPMTGGVPDDR
jgi:hypothetical protein